MLTILSVTRLPVAGDHPCFSPTLPYHRIAVASELVAAARTVRALRSAAD